MPFIARIEARVFSYSTEVLSRVKTSLLNIFPEVVQERLEFSQKTNESHLGIPIIVLEARLKHKQSASIVLESLLNRLPQEDKILLRDTLERRVDESGTFHMRIDKQAAYQGNIELPINPDVINIRIHIQDYPRCTMEESRDFILSHLESLEE